MLTKTTTTAEGSSLLEKMFLATIFLIPLWPRYAMISIQGLPNINLTRFVIFVLLSFWFLTLLGFRRYKERYGALYRDHRLIVLATIGLFVWRLLSLIKAPSLKAVFIVMDELFTWYLLGAVCFVVLQGPRRIQRFLYAMIWTSLVISLIGVVEARVEHNLFVDMFPAGSEDIARMLVYKYREHYRIMATFTNGLSLAEYLSFMMPILAYAVLFGSSIRMQVLSLVVAVLAMVNIWLTASRGAWVVLLMMLLSFVALYYRRKVRTGRRRVALFVASVVVPIMLAAVFAAVFVVGQYARGKTIDEIESSHARLRQLEIGLPLVLDSPLLGYGPGQAALAIGMTTKSVDNYYLTIALESGLPSLLLLLSILVAVVKVGYDRYLSENDDAGILTAVLATSIVGFSVFQMVLSLKEVFPIVFVTFAVILVCERTPKSVANSSSSAPSGRASG